MSFLIQRFPRTAVLAGTILAVSVAFFAAPRLSFTDTVVGAGSGTAERLFGTTVLSQSFRPARDHLSAVEISTGPDTPGETVLEFTLSLEGRADPLRRVRAPVGTLRGEPPQTLRLSFPPLADSGGKQFRFSLSAPQATKQNGMEILHEIDGSKYPAGERSINGQVRPGDIGFRTFILGSRLASWQHRFLEDRAGLWVVGALVALLTSLMSIDLAQRRTRRAVITASLALALLYAAPFFAQLGRWAHDESDWPEAVSYYAAARFSLAAHQFPDWTPYICGGSPHFANPQAYVPSAPFFLSLLFGEVVGPKLAVPLVLAAGIAGMTLLARLLNLRGLAALLPGVVFLLGGFPTTHLANGQFLWLTLAWVPWILFGFLRSLSHSWRWSLLSAAFLSLTFLEGRVYLVAYAALALFLTGSILSLSQRATRPLARVLLIGLLTVLLSAWKLLPSLVFLSDAESSLPNTAGVPLAALDEAFLRRDVTPNVTDRYGMSDLVRHEYAAYLGIAPLVLALFSLHRQTRRTALVVAAVGSVFLLLALHGGPSSLLERIPLVRELRNPSRMLSMVTLAVALLAGLGLRVLETLPAGRPRTRRLAAVGIFLVIVADLMAVGWKQFASTFRFAPTQLAFDDPRFFQTSLPVGRDTNNGYIAIRAGKGSKNFCPVVLRAYRATRPVRAREEPAYRGEAQAQGAGRVEIRAFSPNAVTLAVDAPVADRILVNQSYDRGWRADPFTVRNHDGLLAVDIPAGSHEVRLRYRPPGRGLGSVLTLGTLALFGAHWRLQSRRPS